MKHLRELWNNAQSKAHETPARAVPAPHGPAPQIQLLFSDLMGRMAIRGFQLLVLGLVAVCIIWGLLRVTTIVIPALIATILACALWPLVARLRKHLPNLLTAWTVFLSALLVLGGIGAGVVASVISQWDELAQQAQRGFAQLGQWSQQVLERLPFDVGQQRLDGVLQSAGKLLTSSEVGSGALHTLGAAGEVATGAILLLVVLFFFLKDGDRIWAFILSWTPRRYRAKWIASGDQALRTFGGYVRGTAIVASVDAVGITAALLILRVPLALPLGVVVFLGSFIPLVGATVAGTLSVLVALVASGPASALIILAVVVGVNQLEGHFLQPVVMARALRLHALVVLIALAVGTALGGIIGAVLAVPMTAVGWAVIKIWTERDGEIATEQVRQELIQAHDDDGRDSGHQVDASKSEQSMDTPAESEGPTRDEERSQTSGSDSDPTPRQVE